MKIKKNKKNPLELMSLFDGAGCFPISWANVNKIPFKDLEYQSSEVEAFLTELLSSNFPKSNQLFDITKLTIEELKNIKCNIITMGTPCSGFSISGFREGLENEQSKLFVNGVEIIDQIRPEYFIWENVFGVFSANQNKEYREILDQFKKIGYDTAWAILDAKFFGLPQRRRRVYMIGVRDGINKNNNIFDVLKRQDKLLIEESKSTDSFFVHDFNPESVNPKDHYAFFNRQRSDKFKEIGISNTLAKRDYKGSTDIVIKNGSVRRIVPKERLRFQGIPDYWFDCTYEKYPSDVQRFKANGMAVNVVDYVFEQILKIDNGDAYKNISGNYDADIEFGTSSHQICLDKKNKPLKIPYTGFMYLKRDENGKVIDEQAEYHLAKTCSESSPKIKLQTVEDFLLDSVDDKFHLTEGGLEGMLKRELKSGNMLPRKMKETILHKYPAFKEKYGE